MASGGTGGAGGAPAADGRAPPPPPGTERVWAEATSERGRKRQRDEESTDTDSGEGGEIPESVDGDRTKEIKDESILSALLDLTSHSSRFDVEVVKNDVQQVLQWHLTDTARPTMLVFDTKYQRDKEYGWSDDQKSQYLRTVMAGRASTPFVVNIVRATARLMDGGHRLHALLSFYKNEVPMKVGEALVYYEQLPEEDRRCFLSRKLQVMEFKSLPLKDEVESYIQLNSGLVFSLGERLHATHSFNPVTKLGDDVVKNPDNEDMVKRLSHSVGRDGTGKKKCGRKDEFLAICYLVFNLYFRKRGDLIIPTLAERFMECILKLNTEKDLNNTSKHEGKTLNECKEIVVNLLRRTLQLYGTVDGRATGQKDLRRLVMCMMFVRELSPEELDKAIEEGLFAKFLSDVHSRHSASKRMAVAGGKKGGENSLHDILTRNVDIKSSDITHVVQAYHRFCAQPPPPPPPLAPPQNP